MKRLSSIALVGFVLLACPGAGLASLVGRTQVVALNHSRDFVKVRSTPVINDRGEISFYGYPRISSPSPSVGLGLILSEGDSLEVLPIVGTSTSDGAQVITNLYPNFLLGLTLNSHGTIAFPALSRENGTDEPAERGVYLYNSELVELVRVGQSAPDGNGTISNFSNFVFNDSNEIAYIGQLSGRTGPSPSSLGIFLSASDGTIEIARQGWSVPNGDGTFGHFYPSEAMSTTGGYSSFAEPAGRFQFALNNVGQVVFLARIYGTEEHNLNSGVFLGDGNTIVELSRGGSRGPDLQLQLNDAGQVAFGDSRGIFKYQDGSSGIVSSVNQVIPDDAGRFAFFRYFQMNSAGEIAFLANIKDNSNTRIGLFQTDGSETRLLVRDGQLAPDGNGELNLLSTRSFAFNDAGQIAFVAQLRNASPRAHEGLFLYDPEDGLIQIARTGQEYLGNWFSAFTLLTHDADNLEGLNNHGQIAYRFQLNYRREGIALWTPVPEPSSIVMLCVIGVALYFAGHSHHRRVDPRPLSISCQIRLSGTCKASASC